MKKLSIKIIKRRNVEAAAAKITDSPTAAPPETTPERAERIARRLRREQSAVIERWVSERRLNRQTKIADAVRRWFGSDELPLGEI